MRCAILSHVKQPMALHIVGIIGLVLGQPIAALAQDFAGRWESTSPLRVGVLGLALDLVKNDGGVWVASLSDPVRKVFGIRVSTSLFRAMR